VPEVVGAELQLESVVGFLASRRCHHAGVIDQNVDRTPLGNQFLTQRRNTFQ
jgi:hypothetical protein